MLRGASRLSLTTLIVIVGLTGCAKKADTTTPKRSKVALVVSSAQTNNAKQLSEGFVAGARLLGVEAAVTGPQIADPPIQAEMFNAMVNTANGAVAIQATSPELIAPELAKAYDHGARLLAVDTKPAAASKVKLFVGGDVLEQGRALADELIRRLPANAGGKVVIGTGKPGQPVLDQRARGMREQLAAKLPNVRVLGPFDTQLDTAANLAAWRSLIAANPDALAFLGTTAFDSVTLATIRAETKGTWLAGSFDVEAAGLQGVKDGQLFALSSAESFLTGAIAGWLEAKQAKDGKAMPEGWIYIRGRLITTANIDEIIQRQASEEAKLAWFKPQIEQITSNLNANIRPFDQIP